MKLLTAFAFCCLLATLQTSCSSSDAGDACVPGATQECVGPGACKGAQACMSDGSGWGACACGTGAGGSGGAAGGGSVKLGEPCAAEGLGSGCEPGLICAKYKCGKAKISCDKDLQLQCLPQCASEAADASCPVMAAKQECGDLTSDPNLFYCHNLN